MTRKAAILSSAAAALLALPTLGVAAQDGISAPGKWAGKITRTEGGHLFGNPDAPTKLVEYMSYTCSHCAEFARTGDGAIKLAYVPNGRVSYEIRHLIRDPVDLTAALLANCGPAEKFGANHDAIIRNYDKWIVKARNATQAQQSRWSFGTPSARFQAIASDVGFYQLMEARGYSRVELNKCLSDEAKARAIAERSRADALEHGIRGTPSFMLDGEVLEDTHDWATLAPQLEKARKK